MSNYKVIFFDAANTLFYLPQGVGYHYCAVLGRHGVDRGEEELAMAFGRAWAAIPAPALTAGRRPDDDRGWWRELVNHVLDDCQITGLDRGPFFDELYAEFVKPAVWTLYPEVIEVLETLSARFPLGVITNFDGRYRQIADDLGISRFFQYVIISSEVGADKPAPEIFHAAAQAAGCLPSEALHIGDDPKADWQGAAAAGLRAFKLQRPENSLRDVLVLV